jgi:hypothetical protein
MTSAGLWIAAGSADGHFGNIGAVQHAPRWHANPRVRSAVSRPAKGSNFSQRRLVVRHEAGDASATPVTRDETRRALSGGGHLVRDQEAGGGPAADRRFPTHLWVRPAS